MGRLRKNEIIDVKVSERPHGAPRREPETEPGELFPVDDNIQRFLAQTGEGAADAEVKVYRVGSSGSAGGGAGPSKSAPAIRDEFLYKCGPEEFDETLLQASYGAGTYRVRMYGTDASGNYGLMVNKVLAIGALPAWKKNEVIRDVERASGVTVHNDNAAIVQAIVTGLGAVLTPILGKVSDSGTSRKAMLEELQVMSQMFGGNKPQQNPMQDLMAMLTFAEKMRSENDPDTAPFAVLSKALDTFGPIFAQWRGGATPAAIPAAAQAAHASAPAPAAAQAALPSADNNGPTEAEMNLLQRGVLVGQLALLLNAAKTNSDPGTFADLIYDNAPEEVLAKLRSEKWFEELCALEPGFAAFKPWCELVRNEVIAIEKEPEEGADSTAADGSGTVPLDGKASGAQTT